MINKVISITIVVLFYFAMLYFFSFAGWALDPLAYALGATAMFGASWLYEKRS